MSEQWAVPAMAPKLRAGSPTIGSAPKQQAIEWRPYSDGGQLGFNGTSYRAVRNALFAVWGDFPIRLNKDKDLQTLIAMAHVGKEANDGDTPYRQLIEALRKYGDLEVRDL